MNLCIDIGNSSIKAALFEGCRLIYYCRFFNFDNKEIDGMINGKEIDSIIISSTKGYSDAIPSSIFAIGSEVIMLTSDTPLPIKNLYTTPNTLGPDRLAAVVGAYSQVHNDSLVIDCGTALTFDFINSHGEYLGGNISPGMEMRFKALNEQTAKLPYINSNGPIPEIGYDTETAIRSGVIHGIKYEIEQFINERILKYPNLSVFFTGGTEINLCESIKNRIFVDKYIVLKGLNAILEHLNSIK